MFSMMKALANACPESSVFSHIVTALPPYWLNYNSAKEQKYF